MHELYINLSISTDKIFNSENLNSIKVYPRFQDTVLSVVISSGIFTTQKDMELFQLMTSWKSLLNSFNYRLTATDMYLFSNPSQEKIIEMNKGIISGRTREQINKSLRDIIQHLLDKYSSETKINEDTILFWK